MSECITTEPSENYDNLRKQFLSLRTLANSQQKQLTALKAKDYQECRSAALAGSSEIQAHRANNEMLTEALLLCEAERDALAKRVEELERHLKIAQESPSYHEACEDVEAGFLMLCAALDIDPSGYDTDSATATCISNALTDIAKKLRPFRFKPDDDEGRLILNAAPTPPASIPPNPQWDAIPMGNVDSGVSEFNRLYLTPCTPPASADPVDAQVLVEGSITITPECQIVASGFHFASGDGGPCHPGSAMKLIESRVRRAASLQRADSTWSITSAPPASAEGFDVQRLLHDLEELVEKDPDGSIKQVARILADWIERGNYGNPPASAEGLDKAGMVKRLRSLVCKNISNSPLASDDLLETLKEIHNGDFDIKQGGDK